MPKSDLPFGSEFSPSQIDLPEVLEIARIHGGDPKAFEAAVRARYFESYATTDYNRGKLANNCKLGMIAYGIIDRKARLTDFGEGLRTIRNDPRALYTALARHILLNLHGITLLQTIRDIEARGETVTLNKLRRWLEERGIHFPMTSRNWPARPMGSSSTRRTYPRACSIRLREPATSLLPAAQKRRAEGRNLSS